MPIKFLFSKDAFPTLLLVFCAVIAFLVANGSYEADYHHLLQYELGGSIVGVNLKGPIHFIVNDILMAIFFLVIGCEIKRELVVGELSSVRRALFPVIGAIGGMAVPALIYYAINIEHPESVRGWAIPSATDIAFSLGILGFFSLSVPTSMRIFLTALAIVDDLGAIVIIALFFTGELAVPYLVGVGGLAIVLLAMNRLRVYALTPYLLLAPVVWYCFHHAGIHATVAGVFLAMFIPARGSKHHSPVEDLEHALIPWVKYAILPIFAFANSGVSLKGMKSDMLLDPVPLGVILGLFLGKQLGVVGFSFVSHIFGIARKPNDATWPQLYSIAVLTGIGFTMSLFIAGLSFPTDPSIAGDIYALRGITSPDVMLIESKLGIFVGSALSAGFGVLLLSVSAIKKRKISL